MSVQTIHRYIRVCLYIILIPIFIVCIYVYVNRCLINVGFKKLPFYSNYELLLNYYWKLETLMIFNI